jgi:hypothetical protein
MIAPDRIQNYAAMARSWAKIARGQSYYHLPQGLGVAFVPGQLRGYFNDLRHKADWPGPTDGDGLPLLSDPQGQRHHFPTAIFQKALGHWDRWLLEGEPAESAHRAAVLRTADWALRTQAADGGWIWPDAFCHGRMTSRCSAMSQGEGASLLVRAHTIAPARGYLAGAERALDKLLQPLRDGGCSVRVHGGLRLEEYPHTTPSSVLNGWIFGLVGLYDVGLLAPRGDRAEALGDTMIALCEALPRYDLGYWSRYDLQQMVASPFYHALHIAQLLALESMFPHHAAAIAPIRERFLAYQASPLCAARALAAKVGQKLLDPPRALA